MSYHFTRVLFKNGSHLCVGHVLLNLSKVPVKFLWLLISILACIIRGKQVSRAAN